jgi:hypothetical protein
MTDKQKLKWIVAVMKNLRKNAIKQGKQDIEIVLTHLIEMSERKSK